MKEKCLIFLVILFANIISPNNSTIFSQDVCQSAGDIVKSTPLSNPDRGFHLESGYFAHNMTNPFGKKKELYPDGFIDARERDFNAQKEGITLLQLYIYLTEWVDKDISQEGLDNIQLLFDDLKKHGYKAILRFAYNWTGLNTSGGESEKWILRHIEQLTPIFEKNRGLIATIQIGFIGAWGEWHNTPLQKDFDAKSAVVNALLDIYPYSLQIRVPTHKNRLILKNGSDKMRIGYANDYFTAGEHSHALGNDFVPGSEWYKQIEKESPYFFMSGEIPYDEDSEWGLASLINPETTLRILRDHHYSALDITQNYELNISSWKNIKVCPELLRKNNILFSDDYFIDDKGINVSRSFFEFVRDHLGYRLNMLNSKFDISDNNLVYDLEFTNTGFATVVNPKQVYLVFIDNKDNEIKETVKIDAKPVEWQPYDTNLNTYEPTSHRLTGSCALSALPEGMYRVGLWMPDTELSLQYNNLYDVKWTPNKNLYHWYDSDKKYAINIIGEITSQ